MFRSFLAIECSKLVYVEFHNESKWLNAFWPCHWAQFLNTPAAQFFIVSEGKYRYFAIQNMEKMTPGFLLKMAEIVSTWFYVGKIRWAPGTWGTLATVPFVIAFHAMGSIVYMGITFLIVFLGIFLSDIYEKSKGDHDLSEIVIDEVAGYMIAMTLLPMTWQALTLGFLIFRFFDIFKPFPIGWLDRKISGGLGVMVDDVAAGVITNVILQVLFTKTAWLGSQIIHINT